MGRDSACTGFVLILMLVLAVPGWVQAGGGLDNQDILDRIQSLSQRKEMPADKVFKLTRDIETLFEDPEFGQMRERTPVTGVMVYRIGGGGLLVKFIKGDGLVSFQGQALPKEFDVQSWQFGAHAGGGVVWAAALVMGLRDPAYFGGEYSGQGSSATAIDTTTGEHPLLRLVNPPSEAQAHNLLLIRAAMGLSADAGGFKLNITPR